MVWRQFLQRHQQQIPVIGFITYISSLQGLTWYTLFKQSLPSSHSSYPNEPHYSIHPHFHHN